MDVLIDSTLKPWLIEMNISPSLQSSTPVDISVKSQLASDVLNLSGIAFPPKIDNFISSLNYHIKPYYFHKNKEHLLKEQIHLDFFFKNMVIRDDILLNLTDSDVRYLIEFEDELIRKGMFELVFPLGDSTEHYLKNIKKPLYSNLLLAQWQKYQAIHSRQKGIKILEDLCKKNFHIANTFITTLVNQNINNVASDLKLNELDIHPDDKK